MMCFKEFRYLKCAYHHLSVRRALSLFNDLPLRIRWALLLYKVYGDSTLLVLKLTSLNSVNALLVLSIQFILKHVYYLLCTFACTLYCSRHQCRTLRMSVLSILYLMVQYSHIFKLFILKGTILMCFDPSLCIIPFVGKKSDRKISAAFMMQV